MTARCARCRDRGLKKCGCVRRSSAKVRAHLRSVQRKGMLAAVHRKKQAAAERWAKRVAGMSPVEAAQAFERRGYKAGYDAGVIKGREEGFLEGLRQSRYEAVMRRAS